MTHNPFDGKTCVDKDWVAGLEDHGLNEKCEPRQRCPDNFKQRKGRCVRRSELGGIGGFPDGVMPVTGGDGGMPPGGAPDAGVDDLD